jgi:hypothetical protein
MTTYIPNLLTKEECEHLVKEFDNEKNKYPNGDDTSDLTGNSLGYSSKNNEFNKYLNKLKPKILEFYPENTDLANVNTYVREYLNNSKLGRHIDRMDIGATLSLCLEFNIKNEWPLCAEIEGEAKCFNLNVGDGLLMTTAYKTPHWRDTMFCDENERVVQLFIHWKETEYVTKKIKTIL